MKVALTALLAALLLLGVAASSRADFTGVVVGVTDGDTVRVFDGRREVRVRLHGIDSPEKGQAFGRKAKECASNLAFGRAVTVQETDVDRYGRVVAWVILPDGRSLNREMVQAGFGWWYRKYAPEDRDLGRLEEEARKGKRGLWRDGDAMPPWQWRRSRRRR